MEIKIEHLCKNYGRKQVLSDVSLDIREGMFGLLGGNGSGKTTLMRILATVLEPSSGHVSINGTDIRDRRAVRRIIGYLPQEFSVYPSMRVEEALDYLGMLSEIPGDVRKKRIDTLLSQVNLEQERMKRFKDLSGGMKRRFGIAQALLNDPQVLIADEPTVGLDPYERARLYELLAEFSQERIIVFSTHIREDIEMVRGQAVRLDSGRIVWKGGGADAVF